MDKAFATGVATRSLMRDLVLGPRSNLEQSYADTNMALASFGQKQCLFASKEADLTLRPAASIHSLPTMSCSDQATDDTSKGMPREREPGAMIGRAKSINDLLKAAKSNINVHDLPSGAEAPRPAPCSFQQLPQQRSLQKNFKESRSTPSLATASQLKPRLTSFPTSSPPMKEKSQLFPEGSSKPSMLPEVQRWKPTEKKTLSTREESQNLYKALADIGKPLEKNHMWANDDIENKWLRREATYEMFKSLLGAGADCSSSVYDGSTRTPTPTHSINGSAGYVEHDSLSNLLGNLPCVR